jgi:hypothetical protein
VEIHRLVALLAALGLHETRAAALDLDFAAGLLLDELDVVATATDNLGAQVKAADRLKTYRYLLLGPLALVNVSNDFSLLARRSNIPCQTHHARTAQARDGGTDVHLPG